jgi:hypothetical protein
MSGITFVDSTTVEATTGHMLITFGSGGENIRFHLPAHVAIRFRQAMLKDGWQILCAPDAEVVPLKPGSGKAVRP